MQARLLEHLRSSGKLFADETTVPVLDPGRGRTRKGQLWTYARDERPYGGSDPPAVAFVYEPDRKHARPGQHLAGFKGILQACPERSRRVDGYGAYVELAAAGAVDLAFCWAHVRRRFYDLQTGNTPAPIASEALSGASPASMPSKPISAACRPTGAGVHARRAASRSSRR